MRENAAMFYLKNLSSVSVEPCKPWQFTKFDLVPSDCLGKEGKKNRHDWATAPKTEFNCYSTFEGVQSTLRIRAPRTGDEGNPPAFMHGLSVDYDFNLSEPEIAAGLERIQPDLRPQYRETTLSNNLRLVWVFAEPIPIVSHSFAIFFLKSIDGVIPFRNLAGIDEGALLAPERYYTNGCRWTKINPHPFPHALLAGHWLKICEKFDWRGPEFGPTIPMEVVIPNLASKYSRFAEWDTDFVEGSQGPSFWIDGSKSPKSAIVRAGGISTFAAHAGKAYWSWSELIGADVVSRYQTEKTGKASDGIYYDEKHYYSKNSAGIWCIDPKENVVLYLRQERGLSDTRKKGELTSEVESALVHIQRRNRIKTAAPFSFYPEGIINLLGESVLNTHTRKALAPAPQSGPFPFIETHLKTLFNPPEQLDYFLSWLAYFYRACHARSPRSGQAVFLAGGTNVGKTFLSRAIVGGLVGGFGEAQPFLLGEDNFNSELFDHALWAIDDGSVAANFVVHKKFSEGIKRVVANPSIRCNGKYLKANTVAWQGRIFVTLNLDPESRRIIPDTDLSLREKIMIFRAHETPQVKFLVADEMMDMLKRELPFFARFLMDWAIPPHCLADDPRFGVRSYLEKSLLDSANRSSVSGAFSEILEEWLRSFFMEQSPESDRWEGTSLQLYKAIQLDHSLVEAMRPFNVQSVGNMMLNLISKSVFKIQVSGDENRRLFTILRDDVRFPRPKKIAVPATAGSYFEKK